MRTALATIVAALAIALAGAAPAAEPGTASRFEQAQRLAWSGERDRAAELCREILRDRPDDVDARVLLGRILAWEKRWDEARVELARVLESRPGYTDASRALADVELWSGHPEAALGAADAGLARSPGDGALLERRARALEALGRTDEALAAARDAVRAEPDDPGHARVAKRLEIAARRDRVSVEYAYEDFRQDLASWHDVRVELARRFDWGSGLVRVNQAWRFGRSGTQLEVDAYPRLPHRMYLYLNAGVSGSTLFPDVRLGAELYRNFDRGWEASIGARWLKFDSGSVTIWTGTVGKYWRDWWFSLRPSLTAKPDGTSSSVAAYARRYFGERESYAGIVASNGTTPDIDVVTGQGVNLDTSFVRAEVQLRIRGPWYGKAWAAYRDREVGANLARQSVQVGVGVRRWF